MLLNLYIKDFILINELQMDFKDNFSVFTGETGAGKSIFIDAISILCGDRLLTSQIRNGCSKAVIEGEFDVNRKLKEKLEEAGYDSDNFIVTREINTDGKATCRINHRSATVSFVKECLSDIVDIHCQHDNQYLLNDKYHLQLLDTYCNIENELSELKEKYRLYTEKEKEYSNLANSRFSPAQLEMLQYQIKEIKNLNLKSGEEEEIKTTLENFQAYEKLQQSTDEFRDLFSDNDGILTRLYQFSKMASEFSQLDSIKSNVENIISSYYSLNDDYDTIISTLDKNSVDISSIDDLNQRLFDIQRMKRKYNTSAEGLISLLNELQGQIDLFDNAQFILEKLDQERKNAYSNYLEAADKVSSIRKQKAVSLEKEIEEQLKDLSLDKAVFKVDFNKGKDSSKGYDEVIFLISTNVGSPLQPLNRIASGGELSRLMLGLKTIFTSLQGCELVIFDEIDTGVSGVVAFNIGVKMAKIASDIQVFAVTHLAPVACCGKQHYKIRKYEEDGFMKTVVESLNTEQRIQELSVLSTSTISDASLQAAKELLQKGQQYVG